MVSKNAFLFALLLLVSCSGNDTGFTPEGFVESMGLIGQQAKDENPIPYLYDKESAEALTALDANGEKGLVAFNKFSDLVQQKFPKYIKRSQKGQLSIALDGENGKKVRAFTYGISIIGTQLKERKPADYKFVAATEPNKNGVSQITFTVLGRTKTLPVKKTEKGYRVFLEKGVVDNINKTVGRVGQLAQVFLDANQLLESGEITEENFETKMEEIYIKYQDTLLMK